MTARVFEAPGPGTWELDTTHFSKPLSAYTSSFMSDSFDRGFKEGTERYGLLLSHLKSAHIHGFSYSNRYLPLPLKMRHPDHRRQDISSNRNCLHVSPRGKKPLKISCGAKTSNAGTKR